VRVLLGICVMTSRSGAELFVRDVALALNRRGHSVIVYAPIMGDMVDELRVQSITCVTDLGNVATAPDIIIGNTQIETVQCLAQFPGIPAISICHDRVAEHGAPPRFSRIGCYVAVDANCAERLTLEHGISPAQVSIIQNGVDLRRFTPRSPLPERPRTAAIFSNYATHEGPAQSIARACAAEGIALEIVGMQSGNQATNPEEILHRFDLVFAKARCAIEAMAVGCSVIVLEEAQGMAGMVTSANVADWRLWNFGRRLLVRHAIDETRVRHEIRSYSPTDAAAVSTYIRNHASLDSTVEALERMAIQALQTRAEPIPPEREVREFARYVQDFLIAPDAARNAYRSGTMQQKIADDANQKVERARRETEQAKQEAERARQEAERAAQMMEQARITHGALLNTRAKLARTRKKLIAVRSSYSWRATAPLRWIRRRAAALRERAREAWHAAR
jgi:hypothetical protein